MPISNYQCRACHRVYSSRSHLRRHETSHTPHNQIACEFCSRKFSRNDALRRHYKSCLQIGMQPQPAPGRRGRRRKACDNCAKLREPCDGNDSCAACQVHQLPCTYRRLDSAADEPIDPGLDAPARPSQSQRFTETHKALGLSRAPIPFLLNYSAPTNRNPGDVNHALALLSTAESRDRPDPVPDPVPDPALPSFDIEVGREDLFFEDSWNMFFGSHRREGDSHKSLIPGLDDHNLRSFAASRIVKSLSDVCYQYKASFNNYTADRACEFFHEESVRDFTEAYFEHTVRPRSRVVLKTTFNLELVSVPLLLSILIMGATCSTSDRAKSQALEYANMAEIVVFESSSFLQLVYRKRELENETLTKSDLEIIQAALLIILVQIASPDMDARRRIRMQRYPALVCVARAASLTQTKNRWHDSNTPLRHEEFLMNESSTRIMASISMVDCHFIMFFNQPPALTPHELNFDLPAEENGIDISDTVTWKAWAKAERKYQRPPMVSQFLQELISDEWTSPEDPRFENLNIFALFIVISAFHRLIFGIRSSLFDMSGPIRQVDRALQRWKSLWERLQERLSEDEIYRAGFMIHAQDLWVFAKLLLRTPLAETGEIAKDSMSHVHFLLKRPTK